MSDIQDITIILGPPGPEEDKLMIKEWSNSSGKKASEVWLEYVHQFLGEFTRRTSDEAASQFDELLSDMLGMPIWVNEPFMTYLYKDGIRNPGITFYPDRFTDHNGLHVEIDWTDLELQKDLGAIFGYLLKAEWTNTICSRSI